MRAFTENSKALHPAVQKGFTMKISTNIYTRACKYLSRLCLLVVFALVITACTTNEQQVADQPGDEQQVMDRPGDEQQVVDRLDETSDEQQVAVGPGSEEIPTGSSLPENVAFVITIRINPHFDIQVDYEDCIVAVIPVNSDAEAMCQGLDVTGMSYTDGLPLIMTQAQNKGYLENGSFVEVQLLFHQASQQTMEQYNIDINTVIQQYAADHALTDLQFGGGLSAEILLENEDPDWNPEQHANQSANQPSKNENVVDVETDADGNVIYFKESLSGGGFAEIFLHANGTYRKHILHEPDGTIVTVHFDENGTPTQEDRSVPDGLRQTVWFSTEGLAVRSEIQHPDGGIAQVTYHANGAIATSLDQFPDGIWMESTYSEDGLSSHVAYSDGREEQITYHANGQIAIRKQAFSTSHTLEEHFDENGNLMLSISINNGRKAETRFNADRSGSMTQYGLDGSSSTVYFRPDGKVTHGYDSNGNYYEETGEVYAGTKNGGKG